MTKTLRNAFVLRIVLFRLHPKMQTSLTVMKGQHQGGTFKGIAPRSKFFLVFCLPNQQEAVPVFNLKKTLHCVCVLCITRDAYDRCLYTFH